MDVLTVKDDGGEEELPVFSFEEEAEMYVRLGSLEDSWRVRETTAGELISILYGPCTGVGRIVLDPLPEIGDGIVVDPVSVGREVFVELLVGQENHPGFATRRSTTELFHPAFIRDNRQGTKSKAAGMVALVSGE